MKILFCGVVVLFILVLGYLLLLKYQLREIKEQLSYARTHQAPAVLSLEVSDRDVRELAKELSKTLKRESELRIRQDSKEQEFRNLIANVSHDLRTPLTVIKGYLQMMEQCEEIPAYREYQEIITRHVNELDKRIRQLFEYSYWVNQEENIIRKPFNAANLLTDIMTDFVPVFEERGIKLQLTDCCMVKAMGDEELFRHIIQNLLKNALQYTTGDVTVSLERVEWESKEGIRVAVQNPVAKDCNLEIGQVFERFYTGNAPGKQSTGLGLTIVKLLTEKMGGAVEASLENGIFEVRVVMKGVRHRRQRTADGELTV